MIQVNLNYKRLQGFPWFAQMIRKLEYHLDRGPVIFIACGGGGGRRILRGMTWGNGGGISCRQQRLKRRTFENLTAFEWSGWGGGGRRIGQPYEVIRKNFIVTQIKCSDSTPPPLPIISCMTFSSQYYATKLIINDVYVVEPRFHEVPRDLYQRFVTSQSAHKLLLCT